MTFIDTTSGFVFYGPRNSSVTVCGAAEWICLNPEVQLLAI
jgi:hypothetical protein